MTTGDLVQVCLLLVIVWLVVCIRRSLDQPPIGLQVQRAATAVKEKLSGQTAPSVQRPNGVVPLDQIDPEEAHRALEGFGK